MDKVEIERTGRDGDSKGEVKGEGSTSPLVLCCLEGERNGVSRGGYHIVPMDKGRRRRLRHGGEELGGGGKDMVRGPARLKSHVLIGQTVYYDHQQRGGVGRQRKKIVLPQPENHHRRPV